MTLFVWRCWLRALWYALTLGNVSGHEIHDEEENVPALVTTGRCADCGKWSVVWRRA